MKNATFSTVSIAQRGTELHVLNGVRVYCEDLVSGHMHYESAQCIHMEKLDPNTDMSDGSQHKAERKDPEREHIFLLQTNKHL